MVSVGGVLAAALHVVCQRLHQSQPNMNECIELSPQKRIYSMNALKRL